MTVAKGNLLQDEPIYVSNLHITAMKSILSILIIILMVPAFPLCAQDGQDSKESNDLHRHEIGIGLVNLFNASTFFYPPYPFMDMVYYPYYPYYPNRPVMGLSYRLHSETGAWRLGTEFYSRTE